MSETEEGAQDVTGYLIAPPQAEVPLYWTIKGYLPDCPVVRDYNLIPTWRLSDQGIIYAPDEQNPDNFKVICPYPIVINRKFVDLEEEVEKIEILYRVHGKWKTLVTPREFLANQNKIISLASYGLPVTSINARALVQYLYELETKNIIYTVWTVSRCGWKEFQGKQLFVLGRTILGTENGEVKFDAQGSGDEQIIRSYKQAGDLTVWMEVPDMLIAKAPKAMMAIYHALTPPLMKIVGTQNFCVDLSGTSSIGKTTFSRIGASVWGVVWNDNEILKSWNNTRVFSERLPALSNDLPVFLEETQLAKEEDQAKILYMIVNGIGRGRGSLKGLQETKQWSTCLFSTGEVPLSQSTQLEGVRARTISYWGSPFGDTPQIELVKKIERLLRENHGIVGPLFARKLIEQKDQWGTIKARYEAILKKILVHMRGNIESRVAQYLAVTWLAAELFHSLFRDLFPEDFSVEEFLMPIFDELAKSFADNPLWERALEATKGWVQANKPSFLSESSGMDYNEGKGAREYYGLWRNDESQVCIFPHRLKAFLKSEGYPFEPVVRTWKEKGITQTSADCPTLPVKVKGQVVRMVVLNWTVTETAQ